MAGGSPSEYVFRGVRVLADRLQVLRGNELVAVTPKAVKLLVALIERRERVVSKDELMKVVWPDLFVEEGNVKFQVSTIRRTFGQDVVQTIGKLGYQFVAPLEATGGTSPPTNLPARSRALIGRDADIDLLHAMLLEHPLVTVTGTGGVGKTTLSKAVGRRLLDRFAGGVWVAGFPAALKPDAIAGGLASLIGADLGQTADPVHGLAEAAAGKRVMFILDGCEQIRSSIAALVSSLLENAPGVSILATSRIPLRVPGERVLRLEPLETAGIAETALEAARIPAVALFLDRAEAADAKFVLEDHDAGKAVRLCRALSGLPLALEIVGARVPVLGFDALDNRLAEFSLQDADPLQKALELSWSLLSARGRQALPRFSIFGGSFDLDAAQSLNNEGAGEHELLGAIGELVDHSLIALDRGRVPRYRLLDTTRAFASAQLLSDDRNRLNRLTAQHYAARLIAADTAWNHRDEAEWREELAPDLDSIRGALSWAFSSGGDISIGLTLAGRSAQLWTALSLFAEGQQWLERAIGAFENVRGENAAKAAVWRGLAALVMYSDSARAADAFARAALLYRSVRDVYGEGRALAGNGIMEMMAGKAERAEETLSLAKHLLSQKDPVKSYGFCLGALAFVYASTGRVEAATRSLEEGLSAIRKSRDLIMIAQTEFNLAELALLSEDPFSAVQRGEAAAERLRAARNPRLLAWGLRNLAIYHEANGNRRRAREIAAESLPLAKPRSDEVLVGLIELIALFGVHAAPLVSAKLLGWCVASKVRQARPRQKGEVEIYDNLVAALTSIASSLRLEAAMADGEHWTSVEAVDAAAELLDIPEEVAQLSNPLVRLAPAR